MPVSPEGRANAWAWSAVTSSVSERASTAELWQAVRDAQAQAPDVAAPPSFAGITELRSIAVRGREAQRLFARANPADPFTAELAPQWISSRSLAEQSSQPRYMATFDMTHVLPSGETVTVRRAMIDVWRPGLSVGDVIDAVRDSAESLADEYGTELVDVGNLATVTI